MKSTYSNIKTKFINNKIQTKFINEKPIYMYIKSNELMQIAIEETIKSPF